MVRSELRSFGFAQYLTSFLHTKPVSITDLCPYLIDVPVFKAYYSLKDSFKRPQDSAMQAHPTTNSRHASAALACGSAGGGKGSRCFWSQSKGVI